MKKLSALLSLALGLCLIPALGAADKKPASAATAKPAATAAKPTAAKPTAAKTAAKDAAKAAEKPAAKAEPAKELVGILIERKAGGFINLKVEGGNFLMTFLDKDKIDTQADVASAAVRYRRKSSNIRHLLVRAEDAKSLRAPTPVDRPYIFNAMHVVLFSGNEETAAETYTVNFKQIMPGDGASIPADEMTPEQIQQVKE